VRSLQALAAELEACDPYTSGHSRRVARLGTLVGAQIGLGGEALRAVRTAALLHDVGKISVPREVLHNPGTLSLDELELVRRHAAAGAALIDRLVGDLGLGRVVRHHHERVDGRGYPDGLRGSAIPLGARIVAVADTFDAIASRRPYRPAGSFQDALDALLAAAGSQLDPEIVEAFCAVYEVLPGMGGLDLLSDAGERLIRGVGWHLGGPPVSLAASGGR
jgi:putative nucleotidyltransferase with HDIG domain